MYLLCLIPKSICLGILQLQMKFKKIQGKKLANQFLNKISVQVQRFQKNKNLPKALEIPRLAIILVGKHPASISYIKRKRKFAMKAYVRTRLFHISQVENNTPQHIGQQLQNTIQKLNSNKKYHGILLQLPLDQKIRKDQDFYLDLIQPSKDVDCLGKNNREIFQRQGKDCQIMPCAVSAVLRMLDSKNIQLKDKQILIIGKGKLVGNPLYSILSKQTKDITIVDNTVPQSDINQIAKNCDIIFSATGQQDKIPIQFLKKDCVIIDIGCSPNPKKPGQVRGDFSQEVKKKICSFYSPVPLGVGPMVVASLINNVCKTWTRNVKQYLKQKKQENKKK